MLEMLQLLDQACKKIGRELSPGPLLKGLVTDAGFTNITEEVIKLPIGAWPKDKRKVSALEVSSSRFPFFQSPIPPQTNSRSH
jgi:hypothetical protein